MFGFTHLPRAVASAAVVICSPVYAEFTSNYRREVELARRLSGSGIAVQRFHYRGQGNSEGRSRDTTYESMREDALVAAEHVLEAAGTRAVAFFGARFGGLIASAAAADHPKAPVALWDPVVDGASYFRDMSRAVRMRALRPADAGTKRTGDFLAFETEEVVDVLGYAVTRSLYRSTVRRTLADAIGPAQRRLLLVRLGRDASRDRALDSSVAVLRRVGLDVDERVLGERQSWWLSTDPAAVVERLGEARDATINWLTARAEEEVPR
jgi:alpha/beta superfamily hydrolase